jgi:catalase
MPLPNDERVVALANDLLPQFHKIFGPHPGFRPAHAKGLMLSGTFTPARGATSLTRAPHITRESTPATARFSNSTGLPEIPDSAPDANPRGLAIRFNLADHVHTDIVSHSTDGFPTRDGYEFLEFLKAAATSGPEVPSPKPIENFLASHPAALRFVQTPKPFPSSLARDTYFAVTAFHFTNARARAATAAIASCPKLATTISPKSSSQTSAKTSTTKNSSTA